LKKGVPWGGAKIMKADPRKARHPMKKDSAAPPWAASASESGPIGSLQEKKGGNKGARKAKKNRKER